MQLLALIVGVLGNISSVMVFSSPMPTFWRIFRKRSTEEFSAAPYISCLLSQVLWTYYGILDPNGLLVAIISGAGCGFEAFYISVYLAFASKLQRVSVLRRMALVVALLGALFFSTLKFLHGSFRLNVTGMICGIISLGMYGAPLGVMRKVIRTKSVEYMPFYLSLCLFQNGGIWSAYAVVVRDLYIGVPSGIGLLMGIIQLSLYAFYKLRPSEEKVSKDVEEGAMKSVELEHDQAEMELIKKAKDSSNWKGQQSETKTDAELNDAVV